VFDLTLPSAAAAAVLAAKPWFRAAPGAPPLAAGDALLACFLSDAQHRLQLHSLATGALRSLVGMPIGSVRGVSCRREDSRVFLGHTSFLDPGAVYRLDTAGDGTLPPPSLVVRSTVTDFSPDDFVTEQVFVSARDGQTKIPMFIITAKGFVRDGSAPCLLYGYGGFNISITPSFSTSKMCFVRSFGAVYAVANLRGGGEYGEEWHKAGSLLQKQNTFDDFADCAQWLVDEGYTQPARLAIEGGSNGGLLVAASVNQRPHLFGAAIAHVGVHDMLRFHKFTIGSAWVTDYGCADTSEQEFRNLLAYSPLHNVRAPPAEGQYPAMLLLTGDHDDRVVPLHSLKLAATLQHVLGGAASSQRNPLLIRVDVKSGHGAGKPTAKVIDEAADVYGFVAKALGATWRA
jgi:prolyl oligopeptidase